MFPVDILSTYSHEDLESSGENYIFSLQKGNPKNPEFFSVPGHTKIPINVTTVGFVPIYGDDTTHKVLALFSPLDSLKAVALYLADQWWSIDDIVKTSYCAKQGLHQVKTVGERIVLYVLNRIIYRTQERGRNEIPFLCHSSNAYAKIMWQKGEAIGYYSVKPRGSPYSTYQNQKYKLSVLDAMFVRKQHRGRDSGLRILEDFVNSFNEDALGIKYPLSAFMYTACKQYFEKYPGNPHLLWEVEGAGNWFQRTSIMAMLQHEKRITAGEASQKENNVQAEVPVQDAAVSEEIPSEPLNGEVTEETDNTPLLAGEKTANEIPSSESKLQSENQEEEPVTVFIPVMLESQAKPSADSMSEKVLNANDSEVLTEESVPVEEEGTEEQQESEKNTSEKAAASASKEERSDNGLPDSAVTQTAEESVLENISSKPASSSEDQNEEAGHSSQEASVPLSQSSSTAVELEDVSLQQPSGQEGQKNQLEERSEEPLEQIDQCTQTAVERAADSSSEETEIEIPVIDRRTLRRKAKGYKGPPKKKGKPA
ncbi:PREDICTED: soluble lamin-associated protein of 75 kDa [Apaloderma vittatum]|uniref:soluble lamin-associated protein of 75 kDa n=1 Tax=Apaloderma vittatum TaxID=57397 RepID=UPI0005213A33|nr:PREDICTED: soluble lamin-associated protein of 75 kDa [Apaloderma vittatum]